MDFQSIIRLFWRRKTLIIATIVLSVTLAGIYAFLATPMYKAKLQLLFEPNTGAVVNFDAVLNHQPQDEAALLGQRLIPLAPALPTFGDERAIGARLRPATDKMLIAPEATA